MSIRKIDDPRPHIRFKGDPGHYYVKGRKYKVKMPKVKKPIGRPRVPAHLQKTGRYIYHKMPFRRPRYCRIFRQLMQYPLARDPRVQINWVKGNSAKIKYTAALTGATNTTLIWYNKPVAELRGSKPCLRSEPRAPSAICMNILFFLLREAIKKDTLVFEFSSVHKFKVKVLNRAPEEHLSDKLAADAIRLWQQLGIEWPDLKLDPPFAKVTATKHVLPYLNLEYSSFKITLNKQWVQLCKETQVHSIVIPLPWHATTQNMVLYSILFGSGRYHINEFVYHTSGNKKARRKTPHCPLETLICVRDWYKKNLGKFEYERDAYTHSDKCNFQPWKASRYMNVTVERPHAWRKNYGPRFPKKAAYQADTLKRPQQKEGQKAQRAQQP